MKLITFIYQYTPPPSRNAIINYVRCALKRISNYIIDCMASYYGAPANRLTATLTVIDLDILLSFGCEFVINFIVIMKIFTELNLHAFQECCKSFSMSIYLYIRASYNGIV